MKCVIDDFKFVKNTRCGLIRCHYSRGYLNEFEEKPECLGHPAGPYDPMGQTVYCDGSCRTPQKPIVDQATKDLAMEHLRAPRITHEGPNVALEVELAGIPDDRE